MVILYPDTFSIKEQTPGGN